MTINEWMNELMNVGTNERMTSRMNEWMERVPRASSGTWRCRAAARRGAVGTAGLLWWCHWPPPSWCSSQTESDPRSRSPTSPRLHTHTRVTTLFFLVIFTVNLKIDPKPESLKPVRARWWLLTEGPDVRLAAVFTVVKNFWWRPLHRELCTTRTGVLVV